MSAGRNLKGATLSTVAALGLCFAVAGAVGPAAAASSVSVVVNNTPITTYQIRQRAAFMQLRRVEGDRTAKAREELIDEALKKQEMSRRGISVPEAAVNDAFGRFAADNKLSEDQLRQVLQQAGFSEDGFKDYIRTQMGWGEALRAKVRQDEQLTEQEAVQRMLQQGGDKPQTTEYTLQQMIFVIPASESGIADRRMREANGMRNQFQSCGSSYQLAGSLRDVTVRDLGRVMEPELPGRWKQDIVGTQTGGTTRPQRTERGVEFIAVCDKRTVSDDRAATAVMEAQALEDIGSGGNQPGADFLEELKEDAQIVRR